MEPGGDEQLIARVEDDIRAFAEHDLAFKRDDMNTKFWNEIFSRGVGMLFGEEGHVDRDVLRNFRRMSIFVGDRPAVEMRSSDLDPQVRHVERQVATRCLQILEMSDALHLLRRYPSPLVGNPLHYEGQGLRFTLRWFKQVYFLGLMNRLLRPELGQGFVALDIGSSYGMFQYLVHREYPGCRQILVDLPEHLLFARYFLASSFPQARIAGVRELAGHTSITRKLIEGYDFVLLPSTLYERLDPSSVDLISSFACLGELSREFFDYYVRAPVFPSAGYFFTSNPVAAHKNLPFTMDTDISILDYPIWDTSKKLYFGVSPVYFAFYGMSTVPMPPFFDYIGRIARQPPDHSQRV
jgi:putative sugar O-methyltransferase